MLRKQLVSKSSGYRVFLVCVKWWKYQKQGVRASSSIFVCVWEKEHHKHSKTDTKLCLSVCLLVLISGCHEESNRSVDLVLLRGIFFTFTLKKHVSSWV